MSFFDHHRPDYSADRIYEAADRIGKERRENAGPDLVAVEGVTRYVCPEGCGADFDSMIAREIHFIQEHGDEAA